MPRLEDRVCGVTGAGRGIGAAVAKLLAAEGAKVVVNDLGALDGTGGAQGPAAETVSAIRREGGTACVNFGSVADLTLYGNPEPVRTIAGTGAWGLARAFELEAPRRFGAQPQQPAASS